jgi:hypothetical protein
MMNRPDIQTAIPLRRYQLADYNVTVLGEVQSGDGIDYRYILAMVPDGKSEPDLYVLSIRQPGSQDHLLKLLAPEMERELDSSPAWKNLDHFCEQSLSLVQQALGLMDEAAHRLM